MHLLKDCFAISGVLTNAKLQEGKKLILVGVCLVLTVSKSMHSISQKSSILLVTSNQ